MHRTIKMSMGVGASSLIMIFVVLATVTLATLALGTAHADYKLAMKSAKGVSQYYKADSKAEEMLALIDEVLRYTAVSNLEKEFLAIPGVAIKDTQADTKKDRHIVYEVPINDRQMLSVVLGVNESSEQDQLSYNIIAWQVVNSIEWDYDEGGLGFEDIIIEE
ncbi:hypothetical protein [Cellulosilyticum sp. I15G10I2]|uniref:hypothetical protein n=1 Tax=Cellulosilyticum sp. I15G10I2 TaxID=1892843 RepID=UPI00085C374B|nr:hypothetical protein [Cellulosilyticum sp. I15G10I2]